MEGFNQPEDYKEDYDPKVIKIINVLEGACYTFNLKKFNKDVVIRKILQIYEFEDFLIDALLQPHDGEVIKVPKKKKPIVNI